MAQTDRIAELLTDKHVNLALRAGGKAALLASLAREAAGITGMPAGALTAALAAREALGSTGFGGGIAVPHAHIEGLARYFGFFARLERPVPFDAIDGQPVDLVMLLLSPSGASGEHLATLAAISRRLRDKSVAGALRAAVTAGEVRVLLGSG